MKLIADLHTHTLVSHHAYSTVQEMCDYASKAGFQAIAITDHAPGMPDAANSWHFTGMWIMPRQIDGLTVLRGTELNVQNYDGTVDLDDNTLKLLDIVIASLHTYSIKPATAREHTRAYELLCQNPLIDIIGHPTDPAFDFDYSALAKAAASTGTALELNSHALKKHPDAESNYRRLIEACLREGTPMSVASDAHISYEIGDFGPIPRLLDEMGVEEKQVINSGADALNAFLKQRNRSVPLL